MFGSHFLHSHSHSHSSSSNPSSRPTSRPPSPTRQNTRTSLNSNHSASTAHPPASSVPAPGYAASIASSHRQPTLDLSDTASVADSLSISIQSPAYGPYTPASDMGWSTHHSSGHNTPGGYFHGGHHQHQPLEIILDSDHLVMRGAGGDMNPAYLSGRVELELTESANIKDINMVLVGKAKVHYTDVAAGGKSHSHTHPLMHHDWSFLEGDKRHGHTLKAGHHSFPFNLMLDTALPSSITTYAGEAAVEYKLKATVVRSGITHKDWVATRHFQLQRTYTPDALEFNQTLEIENTWPGKIMYSLTLPFKAYAAGDDIPVCVKFMPLAKGVRVTAVSTVLKEYTQVHTRHSSHTTDRIAASVKHELKRGRAVEATYDPQRPPIHAAGRWAGYSGRRPSSVPLDLGNAVAGPSAGPSNSANMTDEELAAAAAEEEDPMHGDDEVNTAIALWIPPWTTPTHTLHPCIVTHKLKWSCTISNPDGHISELRCALPIIILDHSVFEEARAAGSSTRALLLGTTPEESQQVDLPSYSNHVYDRVAADGTGQATGYTSRSSRTPTGTHTPVSGAGTPPHPHSHPHSRPPSRPASPSRRSSNHPSVTEELGNPPRRELPFEADAELLRALGALEAHSHGSSPSATPGDSRAPSRPMSRRGSFNHSHAHPMPRSGRSSNVNSRPGSRVGSRANSPERHSSTSGSYTDDHHVRPGTERHRSTNSLAARLHLPTFKPLSSLSKPILRNSSTSNLLAAPDAHVHRNASFPALAPNGHGHGGASPSSRVSFHPTTTPRDGRHDRPSSSGLPSGFHLAPDTPTDEDPQAQPFDPISMVPSYNIAAQGFAAAMDTGLPTYDKSNEIERTKSEVDLSRVRSGSSVESPAAGPSTSPVGSIGGGGGLLSSSPTNIHGLRSGASTSPVEISRLANGVSPPAAR